MPEKMGAGKKMQEYDGEDGQYIEEDGDKLNGRPVVRDEKLVQFARDAIAGKATAPKEYIVGNISKEQREKIEEALGRPIEASVNVIAAERIVHVDKRHGKYGNAGHQMADIENYGLVGYVLEYGKCSRTRDDNGRPKYSKQYKDGQGNLAPLVTFSKRIDREYVVVEAICDGTKRGAIRIESVYTKK